MGTRGRGRTNDRPARPDRLPQASEGPFPPPAETSVYVSAAAEPGGRGDTGDWDVLSGTIGIESRAGGNGWNRQDDAVTPDGMVGVSGVTGVAGANGWGEPGGFGESGGSGTFGGYARYRGYGGFGEADGYGGPTDSGSAASGPAVSGPVEGGYAGTGTGTGIAEAGHVGAVRVGSGSGTGAAAVADPAPAPTPVRGRAERRRTARRAARRRRRSLIREIPLIAVVALLVALVMKTFMVQVFVIPSGSMEQTIQVGDRVLVDKFTPWFGSQPKRGDVVVFKDPGGWLEAGKQSADGPLLRGAKQVLTFVGLLPSDSEQDLIKRVIGVGGDTVECCDEHGRVSVNGTPLDEPYLAPGNAPSRQPFKVQVPEGRLWVMGDHREVSADSRFHMGGPGQGTIPLSGVVGRAFVIAWPLDRFDQLDAPGSLSSMAQARPGAATEPKPMGIGPIPQEPPLVMGVLGILPLVVRRLRPLLG